MNRKKNVIIGSIAVFFGILTYGILWAGRLLCYSAGEGAINFQALRDQCYSSYSHSKLFLGFFVVSLLVYIVLFYVLSFLEKRRAKQVRQ